MSGEGWAGSFVYQIAQGKCQHSYSLWSPFPQLGHGVRKKRDIYKREDLSCFVTQFRREHTWEEIPKKDRNKIVCARLHFQAVAPGVAFDWVFGYEDFLKNLCEFSGKFFCEGIDFFRKERYTTIND